MAINLKKVILNLLEHPRLVPHILKISLKLHNLSYQLTGLLSPCLEPDGLHPKHRVMQYHRWFAEKLDKDWDVLDIGCGNGALAFDMIRSCQSVTAIDISKENIDKARKHFSREGITYICADALEYPYTRAYDAIVLSNVLEHIEDRVDFLKKIYFHQNGSNPPLLLLRVPMITRDWISLYKKEMGVEWRLDHTHHIEYTLEEIFDELNRADLWVRKYDIQFGEFYGVVERMNRKDG